MYKNTHGLWENVRVKEMKKSIIQILELPVLLTMALGLLACGTKAVSSTESPFSKERGGSVEGKVILVKMSSLWKLRFGPIFPVFNRRPFSGRLIASMKVVERISE